MTVGSPLVDPSVACHVHKLIAEADKMAEALKFYANEANYQENVAGKVGSSYASTQPAVLWDRGQMAQNAVGTYQTAKDLKEADREGGYNPELFM